MDGRTCLITGGTDGIGKATAIGLARLGATVVVLGKNEAKGAAAVAEITAVSGNDRVAFLACDLASQESVRQAATQFRADHGNLHVLVNNAGIALAMPTETVDGIESTFAVNYLSHFLLTHLLLDLLKENAPARIVNVASTLTGTKIVLDDLMLTNGYSATKALSQSKLALALFTKSLTGRLAGTGVTVNTLHPGLVKTGLLDDLSPMIRRGFHLMSTTPEKGARTPIYLASSPEVEGVSGEFFSRSKRKAVRGQVNDPQVAERLWDASLALAHIDTF